MCVCVYIYVCMYVCMYVYTSVCTFKHSVGKCVSRVQILGRQIILRGVLRFTNKTCNHILVIFSGGGGGEREREVQSSKHQAACQSLSDNLGQ